MFVFMCLYLVNSIHSFSFSLSISPSFSFFFTLSPSTTLLSLSLSPVPLPVVSIFPKTVDVPVISTVILTCKVQSLTTPNVTWISSAGVTLSSPLIVTNEDIHYSAITLEKVTLEYIGEYTCTAQNEGGEASDMINVDVYGKECVYLKLSTCSLSVL